MRGQARSQQRQPSVSLEKIIAAASVPTGRNKAGHSQLYEWYWAHFDALASHLMPPRTPNWAQIAIEFAALASRGEPVNDGLGHPPKAITCRHTWGKVVRDKEREAKGLADRRRRRRSQPPSPSAALSPPATSQLPVSVDPFAIDDEEVTLISADGKEIITTKIKT
jgi:hypothetical protein